MRTSACARRSTKASFPARACSSPDRRWSSPAATRRKASRLKCTVPQGAEEADGLDGVVRVARGQIAHGVDLIKIYADYRWGPNGETRPGFTLEEIAAHRRGRQQQRPAGRRARVVAGGHAARDHGRRRDHRAWRRRHARDLEADGREERRVLSDACRR